MERKELNDRENSRMMSDPPTKACARIEESRPSPLRKHRNGIDDLALGVSVNAGMPRAADPPLGAKVLNQLLFQRSSRLKE